MEAYQIMRAEDMSYDGCCVEAHAMHENTLTLKLAAFSPRYYPHLSRRWVNSFRKLLRSNRMWQKFLMKKRRLSHGRLTEGKKCSRNMLHRPKILVQISSPVMKSGGFTTLTDSPMILQRSCVTSVALLT